MQVSDNKQLQEALDLAEDSRQEKWVHPSFVAQIFQGNFCWDLMHPYPMQQKEDAREADLFIKELEACLKEHIIPQKVDETQTIPPEALRALQEIGAFGMKIPKEYGGLGFSVSNYTRAMRKVAAWCGSTAVWLSAHQSIGAPQPLVLFGTKEQKERFLPRLAKGALSAFALTENDVGSDPARMQMKATLSEDGKSYLLSGEKLYCTNGPDASILVVMALTKPKIIRGKEKKQVSAFIVELPSEGFQVLHRCRFMGIRAISNGLLRFNNVRVPRENLLGKEGEGLKIALTTLNTGRLTIPMCAVAVSKVCLSSCKTWAQERVQWGSPIGEHEAISSKLSSMMAKTYAMESMSLAVASYADDKHYDIRLEAAMAKYFASEKAWHLVDDALQIRGGRGYETEQSLLDRGQVPYPIERIMRDLRINRIIEGTSQIMQLFIAREAMDIHLQQIKPLLSPYTSGLKKMTTLLKAMVFYFKWYPRLFFSKKFRLNNLSLSKENQKMLRYVESTSRRLAKELFWAMAKYQKSLEKRQKILGRFVDIGTELFAMACTLSRTQHLKKNKQEDFNCLCYLFCTQSKEHIEDLFKQVRSNHDSLSSCIAKNFFKGKYDGIHETI